MRIRAIKPEFWRSTDISDLSIEDRLLFIGLWSYVDDNGVGKYDVAIIAADLFAHDLSRDPIETLSRVSLGCERLYEKGLVTLYRAENETYIYVTAWETHQRVNNPNKSRFPRPSNETETLQRTYVEPIETLPPGTGEQGNRGTGEQGSFSSEPQAAPDEENERPEVIELCNHLADWIERNGSKKPAVTKTWKDECRRMIDIDGRTPSEIRAAIDWCQQDPFWRANILSMAKLRKQFDQLRLKAQQQQTARAPHLSRADQVYLAEKQRLRGQQHSSPRLEVSR